MKPEHQYLVDLAHAFVGPSPRPVPPPAGLDRDAFEDLSFRHGVLGTFAGLTPADGLNEAQTDALEWLRRTAGRRNSIMMMELERILPDLEAADCRPVVLKGAALAETVYPSPELRTFADLDILVPRDRVDAACAALAARGFRPVAGARDPSFYERHHFHRIMGNEAGLCVEVHWSLTLPHSCYQFDLEGFRARSRILEKGTLTMRIPAAGDQLLHGAMQCIADGFADLRRVVDAALLLPEITEPAALVETARRQNLGTGLWILLGLARDLAGAEVPAVLDEGLQPSPSRRHCLLALDLPRICLARTTQADNGLTALLHILCTPDAATARRELKRHFWPGEADLLDAGFAPQAGGGSQLAMCCTRLRTGVQAGTYLGWRLLRYRG